MKSKLSRGRHSRQKDRQTAADGETDRADGDGFGDVRVGLVAIEVLPELGRGDREVKVYLRALYQESRPQRGHPKAGRRGGDTCMPLRVYAR